MLHAANATSQGYKNILIIANDTDVIVLAISFFSEIGAEKLWVSFGMGKKLRYISIHNICSVTSPVKAYALPAFHALTWCDNTSFFSDTGKKIFISQVNHKTRPYNHIMSPDGKVPHTLFRGY